MEYLMSYWFKNGKGWKERKENILGFDELYDRIDQLRISGNTIKDIVIFAVDRDPIFPTDYTIVDFFMKL